MRTREKIVKILKDEFLYLKIKFGIKKIALFGSFAKQSQVKTSDIDLFLEFERPIGLKIIDLTEYLEKILGRRIDFLTPAGIRGIRVKKIAQNIKRSLLYV